MKKILFFVLFFTTTAFAENYSLIIDAEKSDTSIHLLVPDNEIFTEKNNISLASFADHPNDAPAALQLLLADATKFLNEKHIQPNQVTIDLYGTDGMRLLPEEKQQFIYESIKQFLQKNYLFKIENIQTLSGETQGLYEWIDINYLLGNFLKKDFTVGVLYVDDDSLQEVFSADGSTDNVSSKNFLTLGADQMIIKLNQEKNASVCYQEKQFKFSDCLAIFDRLLKAEKFLAFPNMRIAVTDRAEFVYNFFGVEDNSQGALEARINDVCALSWEQMKAEYADSGIPEDQLKDLCAKGVYLDALIYRKMQLDWSQLWVTNKANGHNIDWTLGAVLYKIIHQS